MEETIVGITMAGTVRASIGAATRSAVDWVGAAVKAGTAGIGEVVLISVTAAVVTVVAFASVAAVIAAAAALTLEAADVMVAAVAIVEVGVTAEAMEAGAMAAVEDMAEVTEAITRCSARPEPRGISTKQKKPQLLGLFL